MSYPPPGYNSPQSQGPGFGQPGGPHAVPPGGPQAPYGGQPPGGQPPQPGMDPYGQYGPPQKKSSAGIIIAIVAAFVLLAGGGIGAYLYVSDDDDGEISAASDDESDSEQSSEDDESGAGDDSGSRSNVAPNVEISDDLYDFVSEMMNENYAYTSQLELKKALESMRDHACGGIRENIQATIDMEAYGVEGLEEWGGEWEIQEVDESSDRAEVEIREVHELVIDGEDDRTETLMTGVFEVIEGDWCWVDTIDSTGSGQGR